MTVASEGRGHRFEPCRARQQIQQFIGLAIRFGKSQLTENSPKLEGWVAKSAGKVAQATEGRVVVGMCEAESSAGVAKVDDLDPTSGRTVAEYPLVFDDAAIGGAVRGACQERWRRWLDASVRRCTAISSPMCPDLQGQNPIGCYRGDRSGRRLMGWTAPRTASACQDGRCRNPI